MRKPALGWLLHGWTWEGSIVPGSCSAGEEQRWGKALQTPQHLQAASTEAGKSRALEFISLKRTARRHLQPRRDGVGKSPLPGQASGRGAPAAKLLPKALRYQLQTIILPWRLTSAPCPGASWPDGARPRPAGGDLITLLICQTARHAAPEPVGSIGLSPAPRRGWGGNLGAHGDSQDRGGGGGSRRESISGGMQFNAIKKREKRRCKRALLKQGRA